MSTIAPQLIVNHNLLIRKKSSASRKLLDQHFFNIAKSLNSKEVIEQTLTNINKFISFDAAALLLINKGSAKIEREIGYKNYQTANSKHRLSSSEINELKTQFQLSNYFISNSTLTHPVWKDLPEFNWIKSSIVAPIGPNGGTAGFIVIDSDKDNFYSDEDGWSIGEYANQVSIALRQIFGTDSQYGPQLPGRSRCGHRPHQGGSCFP